MKKKITENKDEILLPKFFDKYPDIKADLIKRVQKVPVEERKKLFDQFLKFINGEITWGEIVKISKRMQKELARYAYLRFKFKDYTKAETIFKGLAIIDHTNWYYRAALASVYQKQGKYQEAIEEYGVALYLKEDEVSCLINRCECYMFLRDLEAAQNDLNRVNKVKLPEDSPWLLRAKLLNKRIHLAQSEVVHGR